MFIQIEKPKKGDPFFNNTGNGGISTCIQGNKPTDPDCNVLPNCVGGAVGCYNKAANEDLEHPKWGPILYPPNAENIFKYAQSLGLPTSNKPEVGALIIWQNGATLSGSDGAGHVAFVNAVDADGTIHTSESEWSGRAWVNRTYAPPYYYGSTFKLLGFVLQPRKEPVYIRRGMQGEDVRKMQKRLAEVKSPKGGEHYLRETEIDGDFGTITFGALLAFQYDNELEVDGVCGPITQKALGM